MAEGSEAGADGAVYDVVINGEEQYSIWPVDKPPPGGWATVGIRGSREECLDRIAEIWTDMRPRSLRESYEA